MKAAEWFPIHYWFHPGCFGGSSALGVGMWVCLVWGHTSFAEVGVAMRDCETWDMWRLRDMHDMGHVRLETKPWHWHA